MELSEELGRQSKEQGGGLADVDVAIGKCLGRDKTWVELSRDQLAGLKYPDKSVADPIAVGRREAFNLLRNGDAVSAASALKAVVETQEDRILKGHLLQEVAAIQNRSNRTDAQKTLKRANTLTKG